jgi:predicted Holliday junction resolvase-like endonuclease
VISPTLDRQSMGAKEKPASGQLASAQEDDILSALTHRNVNIILIVLVAMLALFAGNTALVLSEFKRQSSIERAELKKDFQKQSELQRLDASEIKSQLMNIAVSAKASEVRLDAIAIYYQRASARLSGHK